ncbi:MAG: CoA transferase [Candidatus Tectomicrobia bacterium]|uniref:CoA transferase n=1 Tax=Tectimicrobiota bacterium TaxID=2528274 RepID=A0A932GRC4_UNCTE|nr:CoA transferase [Candidatus Tectomicrobia bacterium]
MDSKGMAPAHLKEIDWDKFDIATATQEQIDAIEKPAGEFLKTLTKAEYFAGVIERSMLGYPVQTPEDIFNDPQLAARNFWVTLPHPELGREITYPGPAALFTQGSFTPRCRAPRIGEHNLEIYGGELGLRHEDLTILKQAGVI